MTRLVRTSRVALVLLALAAPRPARAQADINPPLTNALLLVDTSGSMEYKADGGVVTCNPASTASVNDKSRWIDMVEVLTGTIENYTCQAVNRTDTSFKTGEYQIGSVAPYDFRYPIPYHRPVSGGCVPAPGAQSSNPFIYPSSGAVGFHTYNGAASCAFQQRGNDGILDAYRSSTRFGLMTFDTAVHAGTGFAGTMASATANTADGMAGLWSYVPVGVAMGAPAGCAATTPQEVGARNAAAPAWEGRMVNFGNPYDGVRAYEGKNDHIQDILLATRPYGATPIAGMLQDASDFLLKDENVDPDKTPLTATGVAADFGPYRDPYLNCSVPRRQIVILLTDGQPNLDLKPYCLDNTETPAGVCPFKSPEEITALLNTNTSTHRAIKTYVIGFALDKVDDDNNSATPLKDCNDITATDVALTTTSLCGKPSNANNAALQACCTLQRIAIGGGTKAFFASNRGALRSGIGDALNSTLPATSRTQPVAAQGSSNSGGGGAQFFSGFVPMSGEPWFGTLQRRRFVCDYPGHEGVPWPDEITEADGDNFAHNLTRGGGPDARRVYSVLGGATASDPIDSSKTIRPTIGTSDPDGVGTYGGRPLTGNSRAFIDNLPNAAVAIPTTSCFNENGGALTADQCRRQYLDWWLGYNNGQTTVKSRCNGAATCRLLGDIGHSTPVVVDRPLAATRDESYSRFAVLQALRPQVMYVSTNDGLLHAFKTASNDPADTDAVSKVLSDGASNELWSFVPPAVLPNVYHLYPHTHQVLLDGVPAVQDVVAVTPSLATQIPTVFQRTAGQAQAGSSSWRTVLVQGFGSGHSGYFALDITSPVPDKTNPEDVTKGGPRMLWQITRDAADKNLFGRGGGTPAITTLFFDPTGGTSPMEIPVAVLPGGPGGTQITSGPGCPDGGRLFTDVSVDTDYPPRPKVHCYDFSTNGETGARSLTIVRLDNGEIIRTFRQKKDEVASALQPRTTEADIDSPITGQPVAFPGLAGQVADRVFVGDQDGRVWRVNVASANPADWTMKLFFDLYPESFGSDAGKGPLDGQPIIVPPILSVDLDNNLVLNVASGDQDGLGYAPKQSTFVYSLTEMPNATRTDIGSKVTWYKEFDNGERVVGPMVLFNDGLYFGTFEPAPGDEVCTIGNSTIWGMNYIVPKTPSNLADGGDPVLTNQIIQTVTSAVAFGPSVMQQPSCSTQIDSLLGDAVLGFGHQMRLGQISTGQFQLVFQTGSNVTGTDAPNAAIGVRAITLPRPRTLSSIESWASIVE